MNGNQPRQLPTRCSHRVLFGCAETIDRGIIDRKESPVRIHDVTGTKACRPPHPLVQPRCLQICNSFLPSRGPRETGIPAACVVRHGCRSCRRKACRPEGPVRVVGSRFPSTSQGPISVTPSPFGKSLGSNPRFVSHGKAPGEAGAWLDRLFAIRISLCQPSSAWVRRRKDHLEAALIRIRAAKYQRPRRPPSSSSG
jgi:hypothetical protein